MEYCTTNNMWYDILNNQNQGALYSLDHIHFMNFTVDYDAGVERKATCPTVLDTKHYNKIKVLPHNFNITKVDPNPVRRSMLDNGIEEVRWDLAQVPRQKRLLILTGKRHNKKSFGEPPRKTSVTKHITNNVSDKTTKDILGIDFWSLSTSNIWLGSEAKRTLLRNYYSYNV